MALDWAICRKIPYGGWCPKGRRSEDGVIPDRYKLQETNSKEYPTRTEANVRDSDGTIIFTISAKLTGGSKATAKFAEKLGKPWLHIHSQMYSPSELLSRFVTQYGIKVLNVAGSRASKEPEVSKFVKQVLEETFFPRAAGLIAGPGEG